MTTHKHEDGTLTIAVDDQEAKVMAMAMYDAQIAHEKAKEEILARYQAEMDQATQMHNDLRDYQFREVLTRMGIPVDPSEMPRWHLDGRYAKGHGQFFLVFYPEPPRQN